MRISDWSSDVCSSDLQVGDQVQTADQLPEFTLETQVGRYAGHFIGQQQGPSGRIASAGQQPGSHLYVAGRVIHKLGIERIRYIKARSAPVSAALHIALAESYSTHGGAPRRGAHGNHLF